MKAITKLKPGTYVFCADGFFGFHSLQDSAFTWLGCWYKEKGSDVISLTESEGSLPATNIKSVDPSNQCSVIITTELTNNEGKYRFNTLETNNRMDKLAIQCAIKQLSANQLGLKFEHLENAIILRRSAVANKAIAKDPRRVAEEYYKVSLPFLDKKNSEPVVVYHESAKIAKHLVGFYKEAGFTVKQVDTYEAFEEAMGKAPNSVFKPGSKL